MLNNWWSTVQWLLLVDNASPIFVSPNLSLYSSTQFLLTDFRLLDDDNSIFCSLGQNYACNWKISQSMLSIWHIFYFGGVASGHQEVQESVDEVVRTYGGVNIWNWSIETVRRRCESYREKIEYQLTSLKLNRVRYKYFMTVMLVILWWWEFYFFDTRAILLVT